MEIEIIVERLEVLERNFNNFLKVYNNDKQFNGYDKDGLRNVDGVQGEAIALNTSDAEDMRTAIEEVYEMLLEGEK